MKSTALLALFWTFSGSALSQESPVDPEEVQSVCTSISTEEFVKLWNENPPKVGTWALPTSALGLEYEQSIDGPEVVIRLSQSSESCLEEVEIWTRKTRADAFLPSFVAWNRVVRTLGYDGREVVQGMGLDQRVREDTQTTVGNLLISFEESYLESSFNVKVF